MVKISIKQNSIVIVSLTCCLVMGWNQSLEAHEPSGVSGQPSILPVTHHVDNQAGQSGHFMHHHWHQEGLNRSQNNGQSENNSSVSSSGASGSHNAHNSVNGIGQNHHHVHNLNQFSTEYNSKSDLANYFGLNANQQTGHQLNSNGALVNSGSNGSSGLSQPRNIMAVNVPIHFHHHIENSSVGPAINGSAGTGGQGNLSNGGGRYKGHENEALAALGQARMQLGDFDLAATLSDKSQLLAWNGPVVAITVGGVVVTENKGSLLTAAMFQAAVEAAFAGGQTLVVAASGAATGGSVTIWSS